MACYLLVNGRVENGEQRERYEIHDHEVKGDDVARDVRLVVAQRRWYYLQAKWKLKLNRAKAITFNEHKNRRTMKSLLLCSSINGTLATFLKLWARDLNCKSVDSQSCSLER